MILLAIVRFIFGAKRIPELSCSLGRGTREFRERISGASDDKDEVQEDRKESDEEKQSLEGAAPVENPRAEEKAVPARAEQKS